MPFTSGSYSLPSGNPVVTGTTISSTTTNTTNSDIATALSSCILKDGTQTVTANIPMASHKITGLSAGTTAGDSVEYAGSPSFTNLAYTGTLTGSIGILDIGSGQVYKDASGNVGIGTSSPSAKLVIEGGTTSDQFRLGTGGNYYKIGRETVSTGFLNFYGSQSGANGYVFGGIDGERMRIDSSGNVGIGTSSPSFPLQVQTTAEWGIALKMANTSPTARGLTLSQRALGTIASPLTVTNGTLIGGFDAGGYNGTAYTLGYNGGAGIQAIATETWTSISNASALTFFTNSSGSANYIERMRIDSSGNLLVGTTSPQGILTIKQSSNGYTGCLNIVDSASANKWAILLDSGTSNLYFGYNGVSKSYINSSTGAFVPVSDLRAKKDIVDSKYGLAEILQLRSVEYLMLEEDATAKKHLGLIAQEVKAVIDEAVDDVIDEETLMGLDKSGLVPVLIKAIQEQQTLIEALTARLTALEAK